MEAKDEGSFEVLAEQRLGRQGFHVKLDRGFEEGTYCAYVEFDDLAARAGFSAARRHAGEYCSLLKAEFERCSRHSVGPTEDASCTGDLRRKRDLELTYLTFPVVTGDGRFHDDAVKKEFRLALMRTTQQWDQVQAGAATHRRHEQQDGFRRRLGALLASDAYGHLDEATRERLLEEIPPLAFPRRGLAL